MNTMRWFGAVTLTAALTVPAPAQEPPKPGPELEVLKKLVGTWDLTMKFDGMESKGTVTYKMDLGGLWLASDLQSEFAGQKISGRGFDSYDPAKKKYVGIWMDSMSTSPLVTEGTFDQATKTLTMAGEGPGMDGKPTKYKSVSVMPDDDTINVTMHIGDGKDPAFTFVYKRRK